MGKKGREQSAEEQNSPIEPSKKRVKRESSVEMLSEGALAKGAPIPLKTIVEVFEEIQKTKAKEVHGKTVANGLGALLKDQSFEGDLDAKSVRDSFCHYFRNSVKLATIPLSSAIQCVLDYGNNGKSVSDHPGYPKRPLTSYFIFAGMKGHGFKNVSEEARNQYRDENDPLTIKCKAEAESQRRQFVEKLEQFLEEFSDSLPDAQIEFVKKKVQAWEKKTKAIDRSTKPSVSGPALVETKIDDYLKPKIEEPKVHIKKERNKKLTAFDFYKLTREHRYTELEEDDRNAKLRRHFERLDESKRAKFEEQAKSQ